MTQPINQYVNRPTWYGKSWSNLKQFPQFLAQGSNNNPVVSGPAAAALISAGLGCFTMMVSHHLVDADTTKTIEKFVWSLGGWIPGSHNPSKIWGNIGSYSGKETFLLIGWLISWPILHFFWKNKNIKTKHLFWGFLALMVTATAMTWHPLFPYLPLI